VARLVPRARGIHLRLLGRSTLRVNVAQNGHTLVQLRGYGGLVRTLRRRHGGRLPHHHFVSSHFSPDARHVVLTDERRTLRVFSVPRAHLVMTIHNAVRPRWLDANAVGFQRGCRVMRVRLGGTARAMGAIKPPCKNVLHTSEDLRRWFVADPTPRHHGVLDEYARVRMIDVTSGSDIVLVDSNASGGILLPRVSPDGRRVCFARTNFHLYCTRAGKTELVWDRVYRPLRFDDSGDKLLFANRPKSSARSRIVVVDFASRSATITPRAAREWWQFMPGGTRIVGHGGPSSAIVYDLQNNWQADVGAPDSEWEGVWMVPGDARRFAIGRERRGSRDVYLVNLPR